MRVLFVSLPMIGHLFPMMPLAHALAADGHEVVVATGGETTVARRSGLPIIDCWPAPRRNFTMASARGLALHPRLALRGLRGMADPVAAGHAFAAVNRPMIEPLTAVVARERPDLIVHEPYAAAAAIAADRIGVRSVVHNIGLSDGTELLRQTLRVSRTRVRRPVGVLSIAPPSVVSVPGSPTRHVPYAVGEPNHPVPQWLQQTPSRPRIVVTRSTALGDGPDPMLESVVEAADAVNAEIVIVRPNRPLRRARALPPNVRTVGWIPLHTVLHTCTAMVNHGGAGSVLAALHAGIPQLVTPAPGDRTWNATRVQQRGVGMAVQARQITASHLTLLIADSTMASAARAVAAEIAEMPDIVTRADDLVAWAKNE